MAEQIAELASYPTELGNKGLDELVASLSGSLRTMDIAFLHNSIFQQPNRYIEDTPLEEIDFEAIERQQYFNENSINIVSQGIFIEPIKERFRQYAKNANVALKKKKREVLKSRDSNLPKEELSRRLFTIEGYVNSEHELFKAISNRPKYNPEHAEFYNNVKSLVNAVADGLKVYQGSTKSFDQIGAEIELVASVLYHALTTKQQKAKIALATADESVCALLWDVYLMASDFGNGKKSAISEKMGSSEVYFFSYEKGKFAMHSNSSGLVQDRIIQLHKERLSVLKTDDEAYNSVKSLTDSVDSQYRNMFGSPKTEKKRSIKGPIKSPLLQYFDSHPDEKITVKRASEITNSPIADSLYVRLGSMARAGLIARISRGVYASLNYTDEEAKPAEPKPQDLAEILSIGTGKSLMDFYRRSLRNTLTTAIDDSMTGNPQYVGDLANDIKNAAYIAGEVGDKSLESALAQYLAALKQKVDLRLTELAGIDLSYGTVAEHKESQEKDLSKNPYKQNHYPYRIIEHLQASGGTISVLETSKMFEIKREYAKKLLYTMYKKGTLERAGRGTYDLHPDYRGH